jgi:pimeloyl-ACP methyl ester carboxylesterase
MPENYPVFKTPDARDRSVAAYDAALRTWPVSYEELNVQTRFGLTHLIACGPKSGSPLILLHGQEASATMWTYNIQALSTDRRVYAIDTIGDFGKSQPSRLPASRADYAAWLVDILDQLGLDAVDLVGISYGGFLALNLALAHPERVNRIVLLAPGIPNFGRPTLRWAFYGMPMLLFPSRATVKRFINGASRRGYSAQDPVHEQMAVGVPNLRHRFFLQPKFSEEELGQLKAPCLLLLGESEIMYAPIVAIQRACQLIPQLKTRLIPEAGHLVNSDQPEIVNQSIQAFLAAAPYVG